MKIVKDSHLDHGLSQEQVAFLVEKFADKAAFFIETVELPESLGTVPCGLYGPIVGDAPVAETDVVYKKRGERPNESRLVKRQPRPTRQVTVIGGPHEQDPCVLYTAFGGPRTPQEPGDPKLSADNLDFAQKFWAEHALAE